MEQYNAKYTDKRLNFIISFLSNRLFPFRVCKLTAVLGLALREFSDKAVFVLSG